jgi:hypothetical protein
MQVPVVTTKIDVVTTEAKIMPLAQSSMKPLVLTTNTDVVAACCALGWVRLLPDSMMR